MLHSPRSPVAGFPGYAVSEDGAVWTFWCRDGADKGTLRIGVRPKRMRLARLETGYLDVQLFRNGECYHKLVHRLVASAFVVNPDAKTVVNHKDGNKRNNTAPNLEWVTRAENEAHALANGLKAAGERNGKTKLSDVALADVRQRLAAGESLTGIAAVHRVTPQLIWQIKTGRARRIKEPCG